MSIKPSDAQFYNGHQMNFGLNRVQYSEFEWLYYRYPRFDTYFYQEGKDLAFYTADKVEQILPEVEKMFSRTLQKRIIIIIFNRLTDFRQSNIGLNTEDVSTNTGGVTKIIDNKIFLYFDKDHRNYDAQIKEAIATIMLNDMLYGSSLKNKIASSATISLPDWFSKGLPAYISQPWNSEIENRIKDGIITGRYKKFNRLTGEDAKAAGYSLWHYVNKVYGRDAIPNIIYLTSISKNPNNAFMQVTGQSVKKITPEWREWYQSKFPISSTLIPDDSLKIVERSNRNTLYDRSQTSPDGKYTCYITNTMGKVKLFIIDNQTKKQIKVIKRGEKIEQITDYSYPVAGWHPGSKLLSFIIEEQAHVYLYQYNVSTGKLANKMLPKFDKVFSMNYSPDGLWAAMSIQTEGMIDIVNFNIASGTYSRLTHDLADDINPIFSNDGSEIIFASNRLSDTLTIEKPDNHKPTGKTYDLFSYSLKSETLKRITDTPNEDETFPFETSKQSYTYLSNRNGIINRYASTFDSSIAYIDTTVHYAYENKMRPATDFDRNIENLCYDIKTQRSNVNFLYKGKYFMYNIPFVSPGKTDLKPTYFKADELKKIRISDSLDVVKQKKAEKEEQRIDSILKNPPVLVHPDSTKTDVNNYVFENEKDIIYKYIFYNNNLKSKKAIPTGRPRQQFYQTAFYTDYLVSQIDLGSLNQSYQAFTGGPYYFNPGANILLKIGMKDLMEDYRVNAAMRIGGNLDSYEYFFTFEDLKHRLDKEYVFHRYSYRNIYEYYATKVVTNEVMFLASYPLRQTAAIKGTIGLRYDKAEYLVTDYPYLNQDPQYKVFAKAKAEYVYDNTINLGVNTPAGFRWKAWSELYQQVEGNYDLISSWGCDFRYYQRIHRNLIFATRFAAATSFGTGKIIYYLGGVDNWTTFKSAESMFDQSIEIDKTENYIYQAVGTNMRGFYQNCRNGNTFALINNEIRWPIFRYLANRPINAKMINDFQLIGFFDAGSAWTGFSPINSDNAYDKYILQNGNITMTIDVSRPSIVAGYGFGFRTSLFGYFLRFDWAWGIEGHVIMPHIFYFSLGLDF